MTFNPFSAHENTRINGFECAIITNQQVIKQTRINGFEWYKGLSPTQTNQRIHPLTLQVMPPR